LHHSDLDAVMRTLSRLPRAIVLIDGGSGSGKTEFAERLAPRLGAELVRLDDFYPGWDGLEAASRMVRTDVIERARWQRWDWQTGMPAEWHRIDESRALVVEGCGALSACNRAVANYGIWVELDEPTRKTRALARDGVAFEPYWDRWAAQEREFFARERPDLLADVILAG
jgi:uridine kinase